MIEFFAGLVSGIVSGTGMGGGTILILCLTLFLNINQKTAQATNLIFFIPTSVAAMYVNYKEKKINFKIARIVIITGVIGAGFGAVIAQKMQVNVLKKIFGYFLMLIAIHEIYRIIKGYKKDKICNNKNK